MGADRNRGAPPRLTGPRERLGPGVHELRPGVWVTSGRACVLAGPDHLAVVDPGDEGWPTLRRELESLGERTGKPYRWVLVTHAHPDHVAHLDALRAWAPGARLVAHARSPLGPDEPGGGRTSLPVGPGIEAVPTPGHSPWGDDLAYWVPARGVLFSGDLVQPKGETWEEAFYPSPYPFFTDGDVYTRSLEHLLELPFDLLVTGHREVREGERARAWVSLTLRAIRRVEEAVVRWDGPGDLSEAAPAIFRSLCRERGIPDEAIRARMAATSGPSAFERFDLPGIAWYWRKHR